MRKLVYVFLLLLAVGQTEAQIHEIGVFAGGSNLIGDVGKTNYIAPNEPAFGLVYKWNRSKRHAWRFSAITAKIAANDMESEIPGRKNRGFSFENRITELSAGLEFNFFDFDLHQQPLFATPYIYLGASGFKYDNIYFLADKQKLEGSSWSFAIPMAVGIKMKITNGLILGVESGARYSFVDDIDGSLPKNKALSSNQFGNTNSNDWYVFTGATLTYTFGKNPCYCKE